MPLLRITLLLLAAAGLSAQGGFEISSPAFTADATIPAAFSCAGADQSPPLHWSGVPEGARSLALIVVDPDAPGGAFYHWLLYDLPPSTRELPSVAAGATPPGLTLLQGKNSFGHPGWNGPCPPAGAPHRYVFTIYALSRPSLGLPAGAGPDQVRAALAGGVVAKAQLVGLFAR